MLSRLLTIWFDNRRVEAFMGITSVCGLCFSWLLRWVGLLVVGRTVICSTLCIIWKIACRKHVRWFPLSASSMQMRTITAAEIPVAVVVFGTKHKLIRPTSLLWQTPGAYAPKVRFRKQCCQIPQPLKSQLCQYRNQRLTPSLWCSQVSDPKYTGHANSSSLVLLLNSVILDSGLWQHCQRLLSSVLTFSPSSLE